MAVVEATAVIVAGQESLCKKSSVCASELLTPVCLSTICFCPFCPICPNSTTIDDETQRQLGSGKLLDEPRVPGSHFKALDRDGYDDGGVGDLTMVIDLEDNVMRRKRGENDYFSALKADLLPRVTAGQLASVPRRDQKIRLAKMLFSDDAEEDDGTASEVYVDNVDGQEDEATKKKREERLRSAKYALYLSSVLREPACSSLSLAEISKRYLGLKGKAGAEAALRAATKAVEIASDGFYDNDDIAMEVCRKRRVESTLALDGLLCCHFKKCYDSYITCCFFFRRKTSPKWTPNMNPIRPTPVWATLPRSSSNQSACRSSACVPPCSTWATLWRLRIVTRTPANIT